MDLLIQGLLIGITLTIMIGPITFTILDASLSRSSTHGIVTAIGMWCSDLLFIGLCYGGAQTIRRSMQSTETSNWVGIIGGIILLIIGVLIWTNRHQGPPRKNQNKLLHYSGHWLRGFLVNTFAPFSVFFWPTVTLTLVIPKATSFIHAASFYVGVMASIMTGDTLKAIFAGWVSRHISPKRVLQVRGALAVLFVAAGLFALGKVIWDVG
jgi:threonine/homoserine/homoserine lactone efflux protein